MASKLFKSLIRTRRLHLAAGAALICGAGSALAQNAEPESVQARFDGLHQNAGLRLSGWEVRPRLTLRGGYDDNANFSATNARASAVTDLRGSIDATHDVGPDQISISADVAQDWYLSSAEDNQFSASLTLRGRIYAGNQLQLRGGLGVAIGADGNSASDNGIVVMGVLDPYTNRPQFRRLPADIGVSQDFGRWFYDGALSATYSEYDPLTTLGGVTVGQDFRNGLETRLQTSLGYRFATGYGIIGRIAANRRDYVDASANNNGWQVEAGAQFELTRILTGEVTAGWAMQSYDITGQSNSAYTYGAGLTWFMSPLISLTLDASRGFSAEQSINGLGVATTVPVLRDQVSLRAELEATRQWLIFAEAGYEQNKSDDGNREDSLTRLALGSTYVLTRYVRLNAEYAYTATTATLSGDTTRNAFNLGLTAAY